MRLPRLMLMIWSLALVVGFSAGSVLPVGADDGCGGCGSRPQFTCTYTIKGGDTLSAIAERYGTTVGYLAQANGISNPNFICPGWTILVPCTTAPPTVPSAPPPPAQPAPPPQVNTCPPGQWLVSSARASARIARGDGVLHLNVSVRGARAGEELNTLLRPTQGISWVEIEWDGSAWRYSDGVVDAPDTCQLLDETSGDMWAKLPIPDWIAEQYLPWGPQGNLAGVPILKAVRWADASGSHEWRAGQQWPNRPSAQQAPSANPAPQQQQFNITAGKIAQGEDKTANALGWCELAWWVRGDSKEYVSWFLANESTTIGVFNGTLSCWPTKPARRDLNVEHTYRTVQQAIDYGKIGFNRRVEDFQP